MLLPSWTNKIIKAFAIFIGVVADGIMLFACFTSQTPDIMGKVAFGTLGIMIILLIPIAYNERAFKLWLCLVTVAIFFDTSYLLAQTDPDRKQVAATVENDAELLRLTKKSDDASKALQKKQDEYDKSQNGATLRELDSQIKQAREDSISIENERKKRYDMVESGAIVINPLTSGDIFDAIPKALRTGRQLQAFMYGLISVIIQGMIVFALSDKVKQQSWLRSIMSRITESIQERIDEKFAPVAKIGRPRGSRNRKEPEPIDHETVKKFVQANWIGLRTNKTKKILSQPSFMEFYSTRGGFSVDEYKRIKQLAIDREVISPGDEIMIESEGVAIMRLTQPAYNANIKQGE